MEMNLYLSALRKRWLLICIFAIVGAAAGAGISMSTDPAYQATTSIYFSLPYGNSASDLSQGSNYTQSQMLSYASLSTTPAVLDPVIQQLGLATTSHQLAKTIAAAAPNDTVILDVTVTDTDPAEAATTANAVAKQLSVTVKQLSPKTTAGKPTIDALVVAPATPPSSPSGPDTKRNVALGFIAALLLGASAAVLADVLDKTVRSAQALAELTDLPVIGTIPFDKAVSRSPLATVLSSRSSTAEAFRQIRTNLQFVDVERPVQVMTVTSSIANEGKSTTAVNMAVAFHESGRRVLLVEADLRRPKVADYMGVERAVGLTNVLAGQAQIDEVLQLWGDRQLTILPSGYIPPNPSELLGSPAMARLLLDMRRRFDTIVIDTPPLLPVTDAAVISRLTDGAVVVVRHGQTTKSQVANALRALAAVDVRVLGLILVMVPVKGPDAYHSSYGYHEEDTDKHLETSKRSKRQRKPLAASNPGASAATIPGWGLAAHPPQAANARRSLGLRRPPAESSSTLLPDLGARRAE